MQFALAEDCKRLDGLTVDGPGDLDLATIGESGQLERSEFNVALLTETLPRVLGAGLDRCETFVLEAKVVVLQPLLGSLESCNYRLGHHPVVPLIAPGCNGASQRLPFILQSCNRCSGR